MLGAYVLFGILHSVIDMEVDTIRQNYGFGCGFYQSLDPRGTMLAREEFPDADVVPIHGEDWYFEAEEVSL